MSIAESQPQSRALDQLAQEVNNFIQDHRRKNRVKFSAAFDAACRQYGVETPTGKAILWAQIKFINAKSALQAVAARDAKKYRQ